MSTMKIFKAVGLVAMLLFARSELAFARDDEQRFCIVPVKGGARGDGAVGETWQLTVNTFQIPGLPAPVFTPTISRGQWTIAADRHFVFYTDRFPQSYLDAGKWVREPWSGRVVAVSYGGGLSILTPGTDHFEEVGDIAAKVRPSYSAISVLPRRRLTIVTGPGNTPFVVDGNSLRPWLSSDELAAHGVHGVSQLLDSPLLSATIIRDADNVLHALTDKDEWYRIGSIAKRDFSARIVDVPASGAALMFTNTSLIAIRMHNDRSGNPFDLETLTTAGRLAGSNFYPSHVFGRALAYERASFFDQRRRWRQLTPQGLVDIPGGSLSLPESDHSAGEYIFDVPTLGRTLIEGGKGLYVYDGTKIEPVLDGEREKIGKYPRVYDLHTIGRVLLATQSGIFELTRDGRLVDRPMPFPTQGIFPTPEIVDWPRAGVALVATKAGIFVLDRDLAATPVAGGDMINFSGGQFSVGEMPDSGEMILTSRQGIFLAADTQGAGEAACQRERQFRQAIPDSDLCLRPVPGTDAPSIGLAIGNMVEAPGDKGLLIDTVAGLFLQKADGTFVNLQPRGGQYTRSLAKLPWSDEIIAIGANETVIRRDLSIEDVASHQSSDLFGVFPSIQSALVAVSGVNGPMISLLRSDNGKYRLITTKLLRLDAAVDAPWFDTPVLGNYPGLSSMDRNGVLMPFAILQSKGSSSPAVNIYTRLLSAASDFFAVGRFQTIYVRQQRSGWFRITRDRELLPIRGLPDELVFAHFDPGSGDVLFGMSQGIFAVNANGDARKLSGDAVPSHVIRAFANTSNSIIAGGNDGLFEVQPDSFTATPVGNGGVEAIGSIHGIVEVGFGDLDIIEASNGTYAFEAGKLSRIRDLAAVSGASRPFVFPHLRRVLVKKRFEVGPLLSELARYDDQAQCTKPITKMP